MLQDPLLAEVQLTFVIAIVDPPDIRSPFARALTDHHWLAAAPLTVTETATDVFAGIGSTNDGLSSGKLILVGVTLRLNVICAWAACPLKRRTQIAGARCFIGRLSFQKFIIGTIAEGMASMGACLPES
jgi:hypothetical protein